MTRTGDFALVHKIVEYDSHKILVDCETEFEFLSLLLTPEEANKLSEQLQEAALAPPLCKRCDKFNAYDASGLCAPCEDEENVK